MVTLGLPVVRTPVYGHVLAADAGHGFDPLHEPYSADQLERILGRVVRTRRPRVPSGG